MTPLLAVTRAGPVPSDDYLDGTFLRRSQSQLSERHSYDDGSYKQDYSYYQNQGDWSDSNDKDQQYQGKGGSWDDQTKSSQHSWDGHKGVTTTITSITSSPTSIASVSSPTWSGPTSGIPQLPMSMPTPSAALSPERISLISGQVIKARQRAIDSSKVNSAGSSSSSWQLPRAGDGYTAGQQVTLQWASSSSIQQTTSMNLRLCLLRNDNDLQSAESGSLNVNQACGTAVAISCTASADGRNTLLSFAAPTLQSADSYFVILTPSQYAQPAPQQSPSQPIAASAAVPTLARWQPQKRDAGQIISPAFVLAPQGIDLSNINNLQSTTPSANDLEAQGQATPVIQQPQSADGSKSRPIAWAWIVGPIVIVLALLVAGSLLYCRRQGKKRARLDAAVEQARYDEMRWREANRVDVTQMLHNTAHESALYGIPPPAQRYQAVLPPSMVNSWYNNQSTLVERQDTPRSYAHDIPIDETRATFSMHRRQSQATSASSISSNDPLPYRRRSLRQDRAQSIIDAYDRHTQALLERDASMKSHYSQFPVLTPLPIPVALRPRNSIQRTASRARVSREVMIPNPHEKTYEVEPARHHSCPSRIPPSREREVEIGKSRTLSHSAAERSNTTGKIGTPYDFVSEELINRADQANDVYLQLKHALHRSTASAL